MVVGDKQLSVFVKTMRTVGASQVVPVLKHPPANAGELGDEGSIPGLGRSWRGKWQPTPVFLPGEPHGQRGLEATVYGVCEESDMRVHMRVHAHTHTHMRTVNHRVNVTACQMIKTITQEVGRNQEGTQTVTKQYNCTIDERLNHTEGGGKKGGDLSHRGRGF